VLVVHEWWGLNDYIRRRARMLAELGYTALAVDMYGDGKTGSNAAEATALMSAALADPKALEARLQAACDRVGSQPTVDPAKIAAIGYCFGGAIVLHAARVGMPLKAVVSFHGSLGSFHKPAPGSVKAKILVCHGAADALVPEDQIAAFRAEMDAAGADYRFVAGRAHGFTNPKPTPREGERPALRYDAKAERSPGGHASLREGLAQVFRPGLPPENPGGRRPPATAQPSEAPEARRVHRSAS
jgi:dienelactone hydrolase